MKNILLIVAVLFAAVGTVGTATPATQAECVQRCSHCGDGAACDAIYETCMTQCMRGSGPAAAPPPDKWGALAVSPTTLIDGYSFAFASEQAASQRALQECRKASKANDCKVLITVAATECTTLAISKPDHVYAAADRSPGFSFAIGNAMLHCQRAGGKFCTIVKPFCADGLAHEVRDERVRRRPGN